MTCHGENGVLIYSSETNPIEDIVFENVKIHIEKTSKWDCGMYDLRPCIDHGIEKDNNSAFYIRNCNHIRIEKTSVTWGNTPCDSYAHAIDALNVKGLELVRDKLSSYNDKFPEKKLIHTEEID